MSIIDVSPAQGDLTTPDASPTEPPGSVDDGTAEAAHARLQQALRERDLPQPVDITVGEVRVTIDDHGLIALSRKDEQIVLVPSEAAVIARLLGERLGQFEDLPDVPHDGYRIHGREQSAGGVR